MIFTAVTPLSPLESSPSPATSSSTHRPHPLGLAHMDYIVLSWFSDTIATNFIKIVMSAWTITWTVWLAPGKVLNG